jgi:hypothetical protein
MPIQPPPGTTTKLPDRPATLNRHKRNPHKWYKTLGRRLYKRILPPVIIIGLLGGGLYLLNYFGVI